MRVHVINGRFQPFHNGHLAYAKAAAKDCDVLAVGLTHVPGLEVDEAGSVAPHRGQDGSNPLSFAERALLIESAVAECGEIESRLIFVPFPIERPELLPSIVPLEWLIVTTLHEHWNEEKVSRLRGIGYTVEVVCEEEEKVIRGQEIRAALREGSDRWRADVPPAVARGLDELGLVDLLRGSSGPD